MGYSICKIKNLTGAVNTLNGHQFQIDEVYTIQDVARATWANEDTVLQAIADSDYQIHDSVGAISSISDQIDWLKNHTPIKVDELQPFAEPTYRTKRNATGSIVSCPINQSTVIDFQMTEERYVSGGTLIAKNVEFGDYICAEVYDKDSVIPEAYRAALCLLLMLGFPFFLRLRAVV